MAESWPGEILRLPKAEIGLADLRGRCVMTTYDPETAEQDPSIEVGDRIELVAP